MDIGDEEITGIFDGVDAAGRLRLLVPGNEPKLFEAHQVRLLRDV
jgi:hypothetical protein